MSSKDENNEQLREIIATFLKKVRPERKPRTSKDLAYALYGYLDQDKGFSANVNLDAMNDLPMYSKQLQEILGPDLDKKKLQVFCKTFLQEYRSIVMESKGKKLNDREALSDDDIIRLANTATAIYLENWLCSNSEHRTNVTAFSQYNFGKRKESVWGYSSTNYNATDAERYGKLYHRYRRIEEAHNILLEQERQPIRNRPKQNRKLRGSPIELDYVTVSTLSALDENKFQLLTKAWEERFFIPDDHLYNKETQTVAYQHNARTNRKLCESLQALYGYIETLKNFHPNEFSKEELTRYVSGCMTIYKLERSLHFDYFSRCVHSEVPVYSTYEHPNTSMPLYQELCIGRIPGLAGCLASGGGEGKFYKTTDGITIYQSKYTRIGEPLDVLSHEQKISFYREQDREKVFIEACRVLLHRLALSDLLVNLFGAFPPQNMRPWKISDFRDAANFFAKEFNFLETSLEARAPALDAKDEKELAKAHRYYDLFLQSMRYYYRDLDQPARKVVEKLKPPRIPPKK